MVKETIQLTFTHPWAEQLVNLSQALYSCCSLKVTRRKNKIDVVEKVNGGGGQTKFNITDEKFNPNLNTGAQRVPKGECLQPMIYSQRQTRN